MAVSVDEIISRLGGPEAAAKKLGVGTEAVRKWRQSHSIPARHWPALLAATGLALADLPGVPEPQRASRPGATAALVLADGTVSGAAASAPIPARTAPVGEICFNTGMTGYQETLTDPSYAGQIITFTFPHIGNVGANPDDHRGDHHRRPRPGGEAGRHRAVQLALDPAARCLAARPGRSPAWPASTPAR